MARSNSEGLQRIGVSQFSPYFTHVEVNKTTSTIGRRSTNVQENPIFLAPDDVTGRQRELLDGGVLRPMSTPLMSIPNHFIPPPRALPFPKSKSRPSTADLPSMAEDSSKSAKPSTRAVQTSSANNGTAGSRKVTKKLDPQQIPVKDAIRPPAVKISTPVPKQNAKRNDQYRSSLQDLRADEKGVPAREEVSSPLAAKSNTTIKRPSTAPGLQSKTAPSKKRPAKTNAESDPTKKVSRQTKDTATQTQMSPLPRKDVNDSGVSTSVFERATTDVFGDVSAPKFPEDFINQIAAVVASHQSHLKQQELWERHDYDDPEKRQAIINDFICENLDNDEFLQLVEEVGDVWRRIGLEL
jgi:hypothetical protein